MSTGQAAPSTPAATASLGFPTELKKHILKELDKALALFVAISLTLHMLLVMLVSAQDWTDPTADWTADDFLAAQKVVMAQLDHSAAEELAQELEALFQDSDVLNAEFFDQLAAEQAKQAEEVSQLLQEAAALQASLADIGDLAAGGDLAAELGDMFADLGSFDAGDLSAGIPGLELGAADVQIFAQVEGGVRSSAIGSGVDITALGSNIQISSTFQKGGMSAEQASRLSQQISVARARLGSDFKIIVNPGLTGAARARMRSVGAGGGSTGKPIALASLRLPPAKPKTAGGRSLADVERRAAQSGQMVSACYLAGLAENPRLSGVVVLRFTVNANGSVSNVGIADSNLGSEVVESCLTATVSSWRFPSGPSNETFEYPFTFEPG